MNIKIAGTGSALPKLRVTNDDLSKIMDTSDEWITTRTGIKARHLAVEENTTTLAVEAAKNAIADAGLEATDIDLIIAATVSPEALLPMLGTAVQKEIGAANAVAFDIHAACSGFVYALTLANNYMRSGMAKHALIIGAETLSKIMDWSDRSTCVLFGDGAGAAVLSACEDESDIHACKLGADGARGDVLACGSRPNANPYVKEQPIPQFHYVQMEGQAVYKFAVTTVPQVINEVLEQSQVDVDDVKYYVLHQANIRIIESVAKRLKQPMEKFPTNLQECGNISSASVPILLDFLNKNGKLQRGDKLVLAGFGGGLTWGAAVIIW